MVLLSRDHRDPKSCLLFALPQLQGNWEAREGTARTGDPNWPTWHPRLYHAQHIKPRGRGRKGGGDIWRDVICLSKSLLFVMGPCCPEDGWTPLPAHGKWWNHSLFFFAWVYGFCFFYPQNYRISEHSKLEKTCEGHQVQLFSIHKFSTFYLSSSSHTVGGITVWLCWAWLMAGVKTPETYKCRTNYLWIISNATEEYLGRIFNLILWQKHA